MYSGTADAEPSASAPAIVTVRAAPTAVTYTGDTAGTIGIPIQVSARLDSVAEGAAGPIAGASMQFGMADQVTCTATTDAAGVASCTMIPNRIGNLAVTALSGGDVRYLGNQIDGFVLIGARPSATTVQAAPNPTPWGVDVTLTAAVPAAATGTVAFEAAGTTIGGCAAVPVADGGASCVTDALEVESQQVTATYSGDAAFAGSSGTTSVQVDPRAVEIAYTGASTGVVGSALALSATATDAHRHTVERPAVDRGPDQHEPDALDTAERGWSS